MAGCCKKCNYKFLEAFFTVLNIGFNIWSLASDDWLSAKSDTYEQGLWVRCIENKVQDVCVSLEKGSDEIAAIVCLLISIIFAVISLVIHIIEGSKDTSQQMTIAEGITEALCGLFNVIGGGTYAAMNRPPKILEIVAVFDYSLYITLVNSWPLIKSIAKLCYYCVTVAMSD